MSVWDGYNSRTEVRGQTKRETVKNREFRTLLNKLPDSLSYTTVSIYDQAHGCDLLCDEVDPEPFSQEVAIINTDNLDEKYIYALPGEDIEHGSLVHWMDNYWLVTERDANTTLYTKAKMVQCNYLLHWVTPNGHIHAQWCIVEDGTKYLTGELEDRQFVTTRGDSRIAVTIAKNEYTQEFTRNFRFLIDDPDSPIKLAYTLSKPLKLGLNFNAKGCYKFVLQEVTSTVDDNQELGIADYYKYYPREATDVAGEQELVDDHGKKVYI